MMDYEAQKEDCPVKTMTQIELEIPVVSATILAHKSEGQLMVDRALIVDFSTFSPHDAAQFLKSHRINLTLDEVFIIQNDLLQRPPTLAELILWSIQGSEHCSYKSSRVHLKTLVTDGPHVILGAKEDAGIVAIAKDNEGKRYGLVVSHESHNHPSQIVPYEGAATGVGGNIRDVNCMGADVIAVADALRFGDLSRPETHAIHRGVVAGIAGYGNPIGVPNLAGDVYYHPGYNENCLVTVVTLGVVREDHVIHSYAPKNAKDYVFILVGKPTDNSGFGGASFASMVLDQASTLNKGAIQEPNAFLQRHLLKANYALFDILKKENLLDQVGFKDLGAGGIACASVELAEAGGYGADIFLDEVPVTDPAIAPEVILCAETQERFMWVVPEALAPRILKHYNETFALPTVSYLAAAKVVGRIRLDGQYVVHSQGQEIVNAKAEAITKGIVYNRPHQKKKNNFTEPALPIPNDFNELLLKILSHPNVASRAPILETYDKQVQGRTLIEAGKADAGILQPFNDPSFPEEIQYTGIALSLDQNPCYNEIDAYWGAVNAVTESIRNIVAVGANPLALTDCLCFGNPENPEQMQDFVDAIRGINDVCQKVTLASNENAILPVIAGNVSFYNESNEAIPPSPMICCLGNLTDVRKAVTTQLKSPENKLILIGERKDECGGSIYYDLFNERGANVPKPDVVQFARDIRFMQEAFNQQLILSAHDISDGGIAAALCEMTFGNGIGIHVNLTSSLPLEKTLFSETGGFILEVARDKVQILQALAKDHQVYCEVIGDTTKKQSICINKVIDIPVSTAKERFDHGLRERIHNGTNL